MKITKLIIFTLFISFSNFLVTIADECNKYDKLSKEYAKCKSEELQTKTSEKAKEKYGEDFVRMWDFYLSSCSAAFKSNLLVHQIETVKNFESVPARTRDYIYIK